MDDVTNSWVWRGPGDLSSLVKQDSSGRWYVEDEAAPGEQGYRTTVRPGYRIEARLNGMTGRTQYRAFDESPDTFVGGA